MLSAFRATRRIKIPEGSLNADEALARAFQRDCGGIQPFEVPNRVHGVVVQF